MQNNQHRSTDSAGRAWKIKCLTVNPQVPGSSPGRPPCQTSCRLVMIFNFGAIRNKYGTLRRDIEEQSSCKVVTA